MSDRFELVDAKLYHCGRMARRLRATHRAAIALVGKNIHAELRDKFRESFFKKAWLIDGELAALGGVTGTLLAPYGYVWLAFTEKALAHKRAIVREARRALDELMETKSALATFILLEDDAALRFAVFLGFHVNHGEIGEPAYSKAARAALHEHLLHHHSAESVGAGHVIVMGYHPNDNWTAQKLH